ncbi:MAG TPA: alpha/beta fold hydrolase [Burkholderiales bacterium]
MAREVVCLHGWGMRSGVWDALRSQLAGRSTRAVDLPGYGAAAALEAYTLDAVVDRLASEAGAEIDLVGWSLGGLIALHWAARRPAQVMRLVLLSATPCFAETLDWPRGVSAATLRIFMAQLKQSSDALMRRFCALQAEGEENAVELSATLYAQRAEASSQTLVDSLSLLGTSDVRCALAALTQPTLILHGEGDAVTPVSAARWMSEQLPYAHLQCFSHCGHALPVSHATACAQSMERFLDE